MKKILLSLLSIGAVAGVAVLATGAFFSDSETSYDNTFTAGAIDLKVDSECHRYVYDLGNAEANQEGYVDVGCGEGAEFGNWEETDLGEIHKFFNFLDLKPGDRGEDTISLHVYTNDAWGRLVIDGLTDLDVDCTEPESESSDPECNPIVGVPTPGDGELQEALTFWVWLDQGSVPGFQNIGPDGKPRDITPDPGEGDNIWQRETEPVLISPGPINDPSETWNLWEGLAPVYVFAECTDPDGNTNYGFCQGIAEDGRMVGSTTYYFGVAWDLPFATGNEVQGDTFGGDMSLQVVQHRNNPSKTF